MQFLGGKSQLAKRIARDLRELAPAARVVIPFCGALNIEAALTGERVSSDACEPLIALYSGWRAGWRPPEHVSEDLWRATRERMDLADPLTAFVGFGCSFAGKWFAGYSRNTRGDDFTRAARNGLARKMRACEGVQISCQDYVYAPVRAGDLVYCDPPYAGTTGYAALGAFDYARFMHTTQVWAQLGAIVVVSEYTQHPGFEEIAAYHSVNRGTLNKDRRVERLFRVMPAQ